MKRINVVLEFDDNELGPQWMNPDNLRILLYGSEGTRDDLLKIVSYVEIPTEKRIELHGKLTELICSYCPTNAKGCIGLKCKVSSEDIDALTEKVFTHLKSDTVSP